MKRFSILVAVGLVLSLISLVLGSCAPAETAQLKVVTSTSLIAQIVERVGGDKVSVVNIIPAAQCPGHFDVKPGDIQKLADAKLFIIHNWQGEKFSEDLIASANNDNLTVVKIELPGNWMTPPVQRDATDKIAAALAQIDPDNSAVYQKAATEYKAEVTAKESEINTKLSQMNLSAVNVLCDEQQAGFVEWAGLHIIATYGRPETLTIQVKKDLIDKGREGMVTLVIDNMQTGGEPGKESGQSLSEELGCKRITLSNFPGGFSNTETWEKAIDYNIDQILTAVAK
ncbi:MAG: metal ABC transporter substrate-binding protein [Dehalococcoidales bacterium]|nr:metal ABC transporter substrate-binding protein [Dehalococcoidales bacterium]